MRNNPHWPGYLNTWLPVSHAVLGVLGRYWQMYVTGVGFEVIQPHPISSPLSLLCAAFEDASSQLPAVAMPIICCYTSLL